MDDVLKSCTLCPRNCRVNRYLRPGFCGATSEVKVAYYSLHKWEEPIISGEAGSGTIFFSNCNLKCLFCQNRKISAGGYGKEISIKRLREIMLELQERKAHNINLVTPTMYVPQIVEALQKIKDKELKIPVVYNTSSYENVETIKSLDGLIDIYLADFKYYNNELGEKYSNCKDYFQVANKAVAEMYRQVGKAVVKDNLMKKGLVVRILILPGEVSDSKRIIKYLWDTYGDDIYISLMSQYTPVKDDYPYDNLNRKLDSSEYDNVINYACDLGITKAFIQDGDAAEESFIPEFDCSSV